MWEWVKLLNCGFQASEFELLSLGYVHFQTNTYLAFAGSSDIRVGWGIEVNGRFEAERPPASAGPPSDGRAATLTPLSPLYSTRPCCLV